MNGMNHSRSQQRTDQRVLVLALKILALKNWFSPCKRYLTKIFWLIFWPWKLKTKHQKLLIIGPKLFFSQYWLGCPNLSPYLWYKICIEVKYKLNENWAMKPSSSLWIQFFCCFSRKIGMFPHQSSIGGLLILCSKTNEQAWISWGYAGVIPCRAHCSALAFSFTRKNEEAFSGKFSRICYSWRRSSKKHWCYKVSSLQFWNFLIESYICILLQFMKHINGS